MIKIIERRQPDSHASKTHFPNYHPVLARVFSARRIVDESELDYSLRRLLPPQFHGIEQAVDLLVQCLQQQLKVLIVGDFDVDGATSTALAVRCLKSFGFAQVEYLVPNRFEYGYGLTPEIVAVAAQRQPHTIVTVDNGISSVEGVIAAQRLGIRVLITDHHLPGDQLPPAEAIVNPNQPGCPFLSKAAAGVGVIFYLMTKLRARLRDLDWFCTEKPEPNLATVLDLVALGTVADVVPLDNNNRILIAQGMQRIAAGLACPGINALLQVGGRSPAQLRVADLGFVVGPRLNAAGRLDDMTLGIRCLLTDDPAEALVLAGELDALNRERRSIEASMLHEATKTVDEMLISSEPTLPNGVCFYQSDWHQGVIGILASRLKDRLHRPVIVFADDDAGSLKGSGRSVTGVHLRDVLDRVAKRNPEILKKFGGHAMAAGLSLGKEHLPKFEDEFSAAVDYFLAGQRLTAVIETDGVLHFDEFNLDLAEQIERAGPWGQNFAAPCFDGEFIVLQQKIVGNKHLKLVLACPDSPNTPIDAIAFNADLGIWPDLNIDRVIAVYKLSINEFRGQRSLQLLIDYLQPH